MWFAEHAVPQPPQFAVDVRRSISHPFACLFPSQSPKFALHAPEHTPAVHVGVAMFALEHTVPQALQLFGSVFRLRSQPFVSLFPSQSAKPTLHDPLHTPAAQLTVAMLFEEHAFPQPPQFAALVVVAVSQPLVCLFASQSP